MLDGNAGDAPTKDAYFHFDSKPRMYSDSNGKGEFMMYAVSTWSVAVARMR